MKTWSNDSLPRVFISDPSQLVIDTSCPVWLAVVQISTDLECGRSLSGWVDFLRLAMDNAQKDIFDALLADYGFLAEHAELYPVRYGIRDTIFYEITRSFPRIDPNSIPPGVCYIKYALDLTVLAEHAKPSPIN